MNLIGLSDQSIIFMISLMTTQIINREAAKTSGKGLSFQRTRAVHRLLELMKSNDRSVCYCATEFIEDSASLFVKDGVATVGVEENKNYSSGLSFNSDAIKNTLVAFSDQYITFFKDTKTIDYSVFCLAKLSDEQLNNDYITNLAPSYPVSDKKQSKLKILKKLVNNEGLDASEVSIAKGLFLDEYKKQYARYVDKERTQLDSIGGNFKILSQWSDEDFYQFIKSITFIIEDETDESYEDRVLESIKDCRFYNHKHQGLEGIILAALGSEFDRRQQDNREFGKFVNSDKVQVVYLLIASNSEDYKPIDPSWEAFESIDLSDQRNLKEKFQNVCPDVKKSTLTRLSYVATKSRLNEPLFGQEYVSLRCQIYEWCGEYIEKNFIQKNYSIDELNQHLDYMVTMCYSKMQQLKLTYRISINDETSIKGILLTLIDDCYLSFDEN